MERFKPDKKITESGTYYIDDTMTTLTYLCDIRVNNNMVVHQGDMSTPPVGYDTVTFEVYITDSFNEDGSIADKNTETYETETLIEKQLNNEAL